MSENLSILIPTMNRPDFLLRALEYYCNIGFNGKILVGDSSSEENLKKIRSWLDGNKNNLDITYYYCPPEEYKHDGMVMKKLTSELKTDYAVFSGDDDFLVPSTLSKLVSFLENNPAYSMATGYRIAFLLNKTGPYGKVEKLEIVMQPDLDKPLPMERWVNYMNLAISNQYYVQRKTVIQKAYEQCDMVPIRYIGPELMPCSVSAIRARAKYLDEISCFFQLNPNQIFSHTMSPFYNLIISELWSESIKVFKTTIIENMIETGIIQSEAEELFDREFWNHIRSRLNWQFKEKYQKENKLKKTMKKIPGAVRLARYIEQKKFIQKNHWNQFLLKKIPNTNSKYYSDFMPFVISVDRSQKR